MGGRGYSSATSRRNGTTSSVSKLSADEMVMYDEPLKAWGSDNKDMSFRDIIASQMGTGGNEKTAEYADALESMIGDGSYKKDIWRGVGLTKKEFAQLKAGEEWRGHNNRNALSSWTTANGVALEFARGDMVRGKGEIPVLFVMTGGTKHGKSIAEHAEKGGRGWEQEVLVSRRSKLKINNVSERYEEHGGFHIVEVYEE